MSGEALRDEEFRSRLTRRQDQFLELRLGTHLSWRLIAQMMEITPRTIYDYARQVHEKWAHYKGEKI